MKEKKDFIYSRQELKNIYLDIAKYANKKIINELTSYFGANYLYAEKIFELMKKGYELDQAIEKYDKIIKKEMNENNLTEFAAIIKLLLIDSNILAREYEQAYKNNTAIKFQPAKTINERIISSNEYKKLKINEIIIISKSETGLKRMESMIRDAYINGDRKFLKKLSKEAKQYNLIITDIPFFESETTGYYTFIGNCIYMPIANNLCSKLMPDIPTFYHETTHYLDNINGIKQTGNKTEFYSNLNKDIKKVLEEIETQIDILSKTFALMCLYFYKENKYVNDYKLNEKWLEEIKREKIITNDKDLKYLINRKRLNERKKYEFLSVILFDIFDGIKKGNLHKFFFIPGHGTEYYSNAECVELEFIADICAIINCDGIDFLNHELGEKITNQVLQIYNNFITVDKECHKEKKLTL